MSSLEVARLAPAFTPPFFLNEKTSMNGMLKGLLSGAASDNNVQISMSSYQEEYGTFYDKNHE